jgi:hypothetical protein
VSTQSENAAAVQALADQLKKAAKNAHFAGAYALTQVVKICREAVRASIRDKFTLRNKWTEQSTQIKTADYKDEIPFAEIFVRDKYLAEHEAGETRRLDRDQAVPLPFLFSETKATEQKPIPRAMRAAALARSGKAFVKNARSGKAFVFVKAETGIKPVYALQDDTLGQSESYDVKKTPFFEEPVQAAFDRNIESEYDKAFEKYVLDNLGK